MPYHLLQGGRRRRRPVGPVLLALLALAIAAAAVVVVATRGEDDGGGGTAARTAPRLALPAPGGGTAPAPPGVQLGDTADPVAIPFHDPPRSGLLFDVDTGRVLWRLDPTRVLPIASLTKMMTALVVVDHAKASAKVRITKEALAYKGSGVGVLPKGKRVKLETMLNGLLLPSGNDAAIALAQRISHTVSAFVDEMNARAARMGLQCTHFTSPDGFEDKGNHSCAADLAALGMAVLRTPRLARIVRRREAILPFPIKGGRIYLYNNNPLIRQGFRGVTGIKTGYTDRAGRCLVASAKRGKLRLGVVLLNSPDPGTQARKLLERGFKLASARTG
jgi:serine-type D-Ala-D-Ala carboxypeptidase (penicillin-binding protein 5/6)